MIEIESILDCTKYLEGIKGIIFDLDDTLYSEKEYVKSGYKAVSNLFSDSILCEKILWEAFCNGENAIDILLDKKDITSDVLKNQCLDVYRNHAPDIHLYEGVKEMLKSLKEQGLKIGMITDGRPNGQHLKITSLGIESYFDKIIVTDEFGGIEFRKPNPKSYKLMKEFMEIEFSELCYIGDNVKKDFKSPQILGMKCIWFKNKNGLYYDTV